MDITSYLLGKNSSGGGGGSQAEKITEEMSDISNFVARFNSKISNLPNSYTALSSDSVTLYTPDIEYQNYLIQKRIGGTYRVVWVKAPRIVTNSKIYKLNVNNVTNTNTVNTFIGVDAVYFSPEFSDIETCIQKMKNNELTYNKVSDYLSYLQDTPEKIPISNIGIYYMNDTATEDDFVMPSKISSKEIITSI